MMKQYLSTILSFLLMVGSTMAFVSPSRTAFTPLSSTMPTTSTKTSSFTNNPFVPAALQRQRKSVAPVQTMSLFGLGAPELAIILIAAAFLLGPSKLAELGKDAGKIAGELKEVPKEFQKGLSEGEAEARALKSAGVQDAEKEEKSDK